MDKKTQGGGGRAREARLAAALRSNLRRRKQAAACIPGSTEGGAPEHQGLLGEEGQPPDIISKAER